MNSKTLKALGSMMAIVALAGPARASVATELRCQASAKLAESRLIGCVAACRDRGLVLPSYDEAACTNRCEARYEDTISGLACGFEQRSAASLVEMNGEELRCEADLERLAARALQCSARCARRHHPEACNAQCDEDYAARLTVMECSE